MSAAAAATTIPVRVARKRTEALGICSFELVADDGRALPPFSAGAHLDVHIPGGPTRPYSLCSSPADTRSYRIAVLRERESRGGSAALHERVQEGERLEIGAPRNLFALAPDADSHLLLAGGIGITPLVSMAHRLHALGRPFELHYSAASRAKAGFLDELRAAPWHGRVHLHFTDEGTRADFHALLPPYEAGRHLYACGSAAYMDAAFAAATARGWPEEALHREYFSVPGDAEWVNRPFTLVLARSGRELAVPAGRRATDVLAEAGLAVDVKCTDGLCGVCAMRYDAAASDPVEHRDVVLSKREREARVVLCCSRSAKEGGRLVLEA